MPELSVVIPTFNTASMTLRCCRAVRGAAEVIVVDDGSTDGTAELVAREAPDVRVVRLEANRGFAVAANRGVSEARGGLILVLNSDAMVEDGALQAFVAAFENDAKLGVAGAQLLDEDGTPQWSGGRTPTLLWISAIIFGVRRRSRRFRDAGEEVDWVSGAAMCIRREAWTPFNERYRFYCQDIDLCLRARAAGWDVRIVDGARVVHTLGATIAGGHKLRYDPARLWPDLLDWGRAHYGRGWGAVAKVVLVTMAWLRIVVRRDPSLIPAARALARSRTR